MSLTFGASSVCNAGKVGWVDKGLRKDDPSLLGLKGPVRQTFLRLGIVVAH